MKIKNKTNLLQKNRRDFFLKWIESGGDLLGTIFDKKGS